MTLLRPQLWVVLLLLLAGCATSSLRRPRLTLGTEQQPLEIGGTLTRDLHLGGVIRVRGDLRIPHKRSLYLAAGSSVTIVGNDSSKVDPEYLDKGTELLVHGRLFIAGTEAAPVSFRLDEATPAGENWAGIELEQAEAAVFAHVNILGAETGILSIGSSPQLKQVNIFGSRYGVVMQGGGRLDYRGGRISGGDAGILCFDPALLALQDLQIVDNSEEGLYLRRNCTLEAESLQISRNDLGVVAPEALRGRLSLQATNNRIDFKALPGKRLP